MQRNHPFANLQPAWVPRGSSRDLSGGRLPARSAGFSENPQGRGAPLPPAFGIFRSTWGSALWGGPLRPPVPRCRIFSGHFVGEGLAPPAGFRNCSIQRWVLRPLRRRAGSLRPMGVMVHRRRAGQETRPYKAISVLGDTMAAAAMKPRLSLRNQTGLLKPP